MDGLECKEINKSKLERTLRIDSEFYSKRAIKVSNLLQSKSHDLLTTYVDVSDGNHMGISDHFIDKGVPYYRGQDAGAFFIENSNPICIDEQTFELPVMKRSHLKKGDVLLSIVGTIGSLSLVYSDRRATCSCKLAILRPKDPQNAALLATFLRCKYGQAQISRFTRGAVQKGLILEDMDQLIVPVFGDKIIKAIKNMIQKAYQFQEEASECYKQAKATLMDKLGPVLPQGGNAISVETFSNSFKKNGRIDAEYYQPKYDAYFSSLLQFKTTRLPDEFDVFKNSGTNYADGISDIGVIKTKQLTNTGINVDGIESYFTNEVCAQNKSTFIANNDVIFASMGVGSLGKVSLFSYDGDKQFVTDSTLRIYRAKEAAKVLPEVLFLFLQSAIGQELIYRYVVGSTGIINIYDDDMAKIPIPVLDTATQKDIAAKVQESFSLRRQSKQLLEYAKQAVEMAIEQGEGVALTWLEDKV
jgi:restriction endonuclease S subunit